MRGTARQVIISSIEMEDHEMGHLAGMMREVTETSGKDLWFARDLLNAIDQAGAEVEELRMGGTR